MICLSHWTSNPSQSQQWQVMEGAESKYFYADALKQLYKLSCQMRPEGCSFFRLCKTSGLRLLTELLDRRKPRMGLPLSRRSTVLIQNNFFNLTNARQLTFWEQIREPTFIFVFLGTKLLSCILWTVKNMFTDFRIQHNINTCTINTSTSFVTVIEEWTHCALYDSFYTLRDVIHHD